MPLFSFIGNRKGAVGRNLGRIIQGKVTADGGRLGSPQAEPASGAEGASENAAAQRQSKARPERPGGICGTEGAIRLTARHRLVATSPCRYEQ